MANNGRLCPVRDGNAVGISAAVLRGHHKAVLIRIDRLKSVPAQQFQPCAQPRRTVPGYAIVARV